MKLLAFLLLLTLPVQGQFISRGGNGQSGYSASCSDGPTTNLISRFDSISLSPCSGGTVSSWISGFGTNTATGVNSPTCAASIFGSVPGVHFVGSSSQYFTLSNPISASSSSNITIMAVFEPTSVSQKNTITGNSGAFVDLAYWLTGSSFTGQGADAAGSIVLGTGTATETVNNIYQTNVTYTGSAAPTFRQNKTADATQSGTTFILTNSINAIGNNNGGEFPDIYLGALYIFSPSLGTSDIQTWETTLSCKYPGA